MVTKQEFYRFPESFETIFLAGSMITQPALRAELNGLVG